MNTGTPSQQFIEKVHQLQESHGFDFEDLLNAVAERDASMDKVADSIPDDRLKGVRLPLIRIENQEEMLDFVATIKDGPVVAVSIGDVLCLAIRTTHQAKKFLCPELVQLLDQWFTRIEASDLADGDLLPKLILDECRITLQ